MERASNYETSKQEVVTKCSKTPEKQVSSLTGTKRQESKSLETQAHHDQISRRDKIPNRRSRNQRVRTKDACNKDDKQKSSSSPSSRTSTREQQSSRSNQAPFDCYQKLPTPARSNSSSSERNDSRSIPSKDRSVELLNEEQARSKSNKPTLHLVQGTTENKSDTEFSLQYTQNFDSDQEGECQEQPGIFKNEDKLSAILFEYSEKLVPKEDNSLSLFPFNAEDDSLWQIYKERVNEKKKSTDNSGNSRDTDSNTFLQSQHHHVLSQKHREYSSENRKSAQSDRKANCDQNNHLCNPNASIEQEKSSNHAQEAAQNGGQNHILPTVCKEVSQCDLEDSLTISFVSDNAKICLPIKEKPVSTMQEKPKQGLGYCEIQSKRKNSSSDKGTADDWKRKSSKRNSISIADPKPDPSHNEGPQLIEEPGENNSFKYSSAIEKPSEPTIFNNPCQKPPQFQQASERRQSMRGSQEKPSSHNRQQSRSELVQIMMKYLPEQLKSKPVDKN